MGGAILGVGVTSEQFLFQATVSVYVIFTMFWHFLRMDLGFRFTYFKAFLSWYFTVSISPEFSDVYIGF